MASPAFPPSSGCDAAAAPPRSHLPGRGAADWPVPRGGAAIGERPQSGRRWSPVVLCGCRCITAPRCPQLRGRGFDPSAGPRVPVAAVERGASHRGGAVTLLREGGGGRGALRGSGCFTWGTEERRCWDSFTPAALVSRYPTVCRYVEARSGRSLWLGFPQDAAEKPPEAP